MTYYSPDQDLSAGPLTAEAEVADFVRYREKGDLEARDRIVESQLKWVAKLACGLKPDWMRVDDAISAANGMLMLALDRFDPTRGVRFSTFLRRYILAAVVGECRDSSPVKMPKSSPAVTIVPFSNLPEHIEDPKAGIDLEVDHDAEERDFALNARAALKKALRRKVFSELEKVILREKYRRRRTYEEITVIVEPLIGKRVTKQRIEQIHMEAVRKLRVLMEEDYGVSK